MKNSIFNAVCKTRYLALLVVLIFTCGNVRGAVGDALKTYNTNSSTFTTGYKRQSGDNFVWWGQKNYYGANNATNHGKNKPTAADLPVVKAHDSSATTSTTGLYYCYTTEAVSNVGAVQITFSAKSGSSTVNAYVVSSSTAASSGSATWTKLTLLTGSPSAQGANVANVNTYTFTFPKETTAKYYGVVFVTSSYWRATGFQMKLLEGCTAPTAVAKGTLTSSSFGLTITDAQNAGNYDIYFSTSSTAPTADLAAGSFSTVNTKTPTISSGVSASTTYYVWARSSKTVSSVAYKSAWVALTGNTLTTPSAGTSVTLSKAATSNGSFTLSNNGPLNTATAQTITVTGTPNTGYYLSGITQSGASSTPTITKTSATTYTIQYPASCTGTSTITATFSPIWQLRGDFNSWGTTDPLTTYSAGVATVTKTLDAMTKYEFKMYNAQETAYYKNIGKIITDISGYDYTSGDGANTFLYTGPAGTYTFKFTLEGKLLQVQYPEVSHPAAGYAYFQQQGSWTGFKAYIYTSEDNRMSDWAGSPNVTNTTNICGTTYYYCALTTDFNNVIFRDNGSNKWKAITTTGYSGKYCGDDYDAATQTWKTFGTYSLTFAGNGNTSGSMTDLAGQCPNSNIVLAANAFAKTDHTFTGWIANVNVKNSSGTTITAGTLITDESTIQITQNTILTAQWTHNPELTVSKSSIAFGDKKVSGSYTETFTVAGNYLTANIGIAVSGTNNAMFTVSSSTLTPSDGSVATTTITVTYSPTTAASHSATITISSTGATSKTINLTGTGQYQDTYIDNIWNKPVAVQTGSYTRPSISDPDDEDQTDCQHLHYHFVGWITKAKYEEGTPISDSDIQATGSVEASNATFYAVWAKESAGSAEVTVLSETFDNERTTDNTQAIDGNTYPTTFPGFTDKAYEGAYGKLKFSSSKVNGYITTGELDLSSAFTVTFDMTQWGTDNGSITVTAYDAEDSELESHTADSYGTNRTLSFGAATSTTTLQFVATNRVYMDNVVVKTGGAISYTDYIASCGAEYNITLDKNGGTTNGSAVVTANATALNSGFTAPVYAGHQVDYYMVASADNSTKIAEADGSLVASVTVNSTPWTDANGKWVKAGDATFYAKWKATECVITLNNEGAQDAGTASVTATYGASTNLTTSIEIPAKNGYDFGGYFTEAGGAGTQLINADGSWIASVTDYTNASKQWQLDATALELHAKWTLKSYTVTWVVNGKTEATQTSVSYGTTYSALTNEPDVADNALNDCGSDKFVGWVTQEYTAEGGTAAAQYDPYKVSASKLIDDDHHTFYAMFAKEEGTAFTLDVTSGDYKISGLVDGVNYYATGALSSGKYGVTTTASEGDLFTFTKVDNGVYTIKHKRSDKYVTWSSSTNFGEGTTAENWTITSANHGSWSVIPASATTRAFIMSYSSSNPANSVFKPYATSNITGTPAQYYYIEIGTSNLTNYRTGCCDEKITLAVSDATSGAGGTVTLKWNNADKSAGDQVSTCSDGTLVAKVTANPGYILTAMAISGTNKSITITPSDLTTGLPSTEEKTYSVAVQALATGTLTITPTFSRTYTVTYDLVDGETSGSTATVRYQSGEQVTLVTPDPTKSGYNFSGWTVTKEGGGNVTVSSGKFTMPTDNVTATATWTEKTLTSISLGSASVEVYVGQYAEIAVTYDPADILTKGYMLVSTPGYCVTTGSTNTTLKITGGRSGVTITENKTETVSIKANADDSKTASVSVTVKPLPVDHYVDLIHGVTFEDKGSTIVNNALSATYTAPGYTGDYSGSTTGDCETNHLHLVGWIDSEWADAHPKASHAEIIAAEGYHTAREAGMTASNKTYYAVWGDEQ